MAGNFRGPKKGRRRASLRYSPRYSKSSWRVRLVHQRWEKHPTNKNPFAKKQNSLEQEKRQQLVQVVSCPCFKNFKHHEIPSQLNSYPHPRIREIHGSAQRHVGYMQVHLVGCNSWCVAVSISYTSVVYGQGISQRRSNWIPFDLKKFPLQLGYLRYEELTPPPGAKDRKDPKKRRSFSLKFASSQGHLAGIWILFWWRHPGCCEKSSTVVLLVSVFPYTTIDILMCIVTIELVSHPSKWIYMYIY